MDMNYALNFVPKENYPTIISQLETSLPESIKAYNQISTVFKYEPFNEISMEVYVPDNPLFSSVVFVCKHIKKKRTLFLGGYWDDKQVPVEDLRNLLLLIPNIISQPLVFMGSPANLREQVIVALDGAGERFPLSYYPVAEGRGFNFELPSPLPVPRIPENYVIERLQPEDSAKMMEHWDFSFADSPDNVAERLRKFQAYGAFDLSNGKRKLVAWTHRYDDGAIGMTHTLVDHRKKGLGAAVTLRCAQDIFEAGEKPLLNTIIEEPHNKKFHEKIGFKEIGTLGWAVYVPNNTKIQDWV